MKEKSVAICTLGCKVNQAESASIGEVFKQRGFQLVNFDQKADIYLINTCTVTHLADRKSRQMIRRAIKSNPQALVVVTGCYAQTSSSELHQIPGVDLIVGTADKHKIVELVEAQEGKLEHCHDFVTDVSQQHDFQEMSAAPESCRTRAFIKVQEGCNNFCAYCIIPYARGPLRSRSLDSIVTETKQLVKDGFKEVVLTGIHTGAYGVDFQDETELSTLVKELIKVAGLARLRLSSVEPNDVTSKLIEVVATSPVFCHHLHIPLQSGSDEVLLGMRRHYDTAEFRLMITKIRETIPDIAITTDVIVGFPGETDAMFENTYHFCQEMAFAGMHVFKYSPRKGTLAATMPNQVSSRKKEERSHKLIALAEEMHEKFAGGAVGKTVEVLAEQRVGQEPHLWEGLTSTYLRVEFETNEDMRGKVTNVSIEKNISGRLCGKIAK